MADTRPVPSEPAETVEWGLLRENGTVAGPLWKGEVLDLGPKWGAQIVSRVVSYGPWSVTAPSPEGSSRG